MYSSYYVPRWKKFFDAMRCEIKGGEKLDYNKFREDIMLWEDNWVTLREENIVPVASGNSVELAKEMWKQYGEILLNHN